MTRTLVWSLPSQGSLHVANCRFQLPVMAFETRWPTCVLRNSEFFCKNQVLINDSKHQQRRLTLDNCVLAGPSPVFMTYNRPGQQSRVRLSHNTFLLQGSVFNLTSIGGAGEFVPGDKAIALETAGNIFDGPSVLGIMGSTDSLERSRIASDAAAEKYLRRVLQWTDQDNVYGLSNTFYYVEGTKGGFPRMKMTLEGWNRVWGTIKTDSLQGTVHYQGGVLLSRLKDHSEAITPADFRLKTGSAGKGAGENGRDKGAVLDLVGPGPAYERWQKTPAYQQWLKDTKQRK
jgi:hypothetical protein